MTHDAAPARPPAASIDEVLDLFDRWGTDRYDEDLSQLDHVLQTAALARAAGGSDSLVAAALLHDVGHLLELESTGGAPLGRTIDGGTVRADVDLGHELLGSRFLARILRPEVTAPIALHVRAKLYRCAVDAEYLAHLSAGSTASLALQGGPMDRDEAASFEQNPGFDDAVRLRGWDDGGKVPGLVVTPLDGYRPLLASLLTSR